MKKTIKEIAEELGVSKQAVWQKIKKEPLSTELHPFTTRIGRTVYVNEQGQILIKSAFVIIERQNNNNQVDDVYVNVVNQNDNERKQVDNYIIFLKGELETKNHLLESQSRQLENKDKQIGELTAALENTTASLHAAQALHAGTMHKQLEIKNENINLQPEDEIESSNPESEKKLSLFARIFKNK